MGRSKTGVSAKAKEKALAAAKKDHILIPMTLITKANIEPDFENEGEPAR
jgi:hypothetical protein